MRRFTFYSVVLFAVVTLAGLSGITSAEAAPVQVSQESGPGVGDFDANVLGFIEPYDGTGFTAAGFYLYGNPWAASYNGELNGGPNPVSSLTQVFLVDADDGLSLFVVHDRPNDGSGGNTQMQWDLVGDTAGYLDGDDPGEGLGGGGTSFTTTHGWIACCTDGFVIGTLEGGWSMFGAFRNAPTGIDRWAVTDNDESRIGLVLDPGRRVRLAAKIEVGIDIKPGSCPNPFNPRSQGSVPVAIIGTDDFDVTTVDPTTVKLAGVSALPESEILDSTQPYESDPNAEECHDCFDADENLNFDSDGDGVNDTYIGDGKPDLVVKFDTQELAAAFAGVARNECVELTLEGLTLDGIPIEGSDSMILKGKVAKEDLAPSGRSSLTTQWGELKSK